MFGQSKIFDAVDYFAKLMIKKIVEEWQVELDRENKAKLNMSRKIELNRKK